jgi:diguanylate cyclase (GGDEF)-like protein
VAVVPTLAVAYFLAAYWGLGLTFVHPNAAPVWPPAGIALAAVLVLGYRVWPGILIGAFFANLLTAGSAATAAGFATGNTLEAVAGGYLVNRFAHGRKAFETAQDIVKFAVLAGLVSTTLSATIGVVSLSLGGFAPRVSYSAIWLTWWLGDAGGALVIAPLLILWSTGARWEWHRSGFAEAAGLLLGLAVVGQIVFGGLLPAQSKNYPLEFLCFPFLVWLAFRFGAREVATAIFLLSVITIHGTLRGFGPFALSSANASLLLVQAFMSVTTVMTLLLAAVVSERRQSEETLRHMAISDSVTGLANHRRFNEVMEGEIKRSQRTGRPFVLMLLDMDGLKQINDRYGHLVGTRALCRLADTLRARVRDVDTLARLGGDEFAVVLLETGKAAARQVADRIATRLAASTEEPPVSVSMGVAVFPEDGQTVEALLKAADVSLYEMKRRKKPAPVIAPPPRKTATRYPQVRVRLKTVVMSRNSRELSRGRTESLGVGGLMVLSPVTFPRETDVLVRFTLPSGRPIETLGVVLRSKPRVYMAIRFQQLQDEARKAIAEMVQGKLPATV